MKKQFLRTLAFFAMTFALMPAMTTAAKAANCYPDPDSGSYYVPLQYDKIYLNPKVYTYTSESNSVYVSFSNYSFFQEKESKTPEHETGTDKRFRSTAYIYHVGEDVRIPPYTTVNMQGNVYMRAVKYKPSGSFVNNAQGLFVNVLDGWETSSSLSSLDLGQKSNRDYSQQYTEDGQLAIQSSASTANYLVDNRNGSGQLRPDLILVGWATGNKPGSGNQKYSLCCTNDGTRAYVTIGTVTNYIYYHPNGGSGGVVTATKNGDNSITLNSAPTRTGFTFTGWNTKADGSGTKYSAGQSYSANSGLYLYAQWEPHSITFKYHPNGGSQPDNFVTWTAKASDGFPDSHWNYANSADTYYMTRTGYTATGDYAKADGSFSFHQDYNFTSYADLCAKYGVNTSTKSTIIDIYAQWKPNTYTVTFDSCGGGSAPANITATYDQTYTLPAAPTAPAGYSFDGWYTAATSGSKVTSIKNMTAANNETVTLYAHWKANAYTVSFDSRGGSDVDDVSVVYDSAYGTLPTPTLTGYTFAGWYTAETGGDKVESTTKVSTPGNHMLYAHWTANSYTVRYDANRPAHASTNVTGTMADSSHTYDQAKALTENGYALVGWTFDRWNTKADGTGTPYDDQESVMNLTSTHDAVVTLYAQWTANTYGVTFNPNGRDSDVSQKGKNVVFNDTYGTLPTPTRTGYAFAGWYTQATGGDKVESSTKVTTASPHTLYARWTPITYTITKGNDPQNGDYALSQTEGIIYDTVTITTTPDKYYIVDTLTVKKSNGDSVSVSGMDLPTGPFTFEMPADDVTVNLTFRDSRKVLSIQLPDQTYAYTGESFAYDCSKAVITCGGAAVSGYWDKLNITYFDESGDSGYTAPPSDVYAHSRLVKASFPGDDIYQPAESSNLANHTINPSPVTMRLKDKSAYWGDEISGITLGYGDVEIVCEANLLESKKLELQQLIAKLIADGTLVIKPDRSGSMDQTIIDALTFELRHGETTYPYAQIHPLGYDKVKQYSFLPAALGNYSIDFDRGDVHLLALAPVIHGISLSAEYTVGDAPEHLSAQASTADGGILSYQWYATPDLLTEGTALKGETGPYFTPSTSEEYSEYYYCVVTNTNAAATGQTIATTTSEPVKITVLPPVPVHEAKITIQAHKHKQYDHVHAQLMPLGITEPLNARNLPQIPGTNPEEYLYNETIVDGLYNLVITAYEQGSLKTATITTLVDLRGRDAVHSVTLPETEKHSIVKDETETGIIVGAVNQAADSREPADPEGHLEVVITTNKGYDKDNKIEDAKQIKEQADKDSRTVEIELDIDLTLYQNDKDGNVISEENLGNTNTQLLEILIPVNTQDRQIEGFGVYRMHNGQLQSLPYGEGEEYFTVDLEGGFITLMVKRFSSYAISYGLPLLPETGDSSNLTLWLFIGMMSLAGTLLLKKRSRSV